MTIRSTLPRITALAVFLLLSLSNSFAQAGFDNATRALYIFDLAKYINYGPGFEDSSVFRIGMLFGEGDFGLVDEMHRLKVARPRIQDKPVEVIGYTNIEKLTHVQVLYVNKEAGYSLDKIKSYIAGKKTMLVTEGYDFNESMINFIVVEGKPRFNINEDYVKKEGLSVPEELLFTAIKSKEDWENLYDIARKEIEQQKETIREQLEVIQKQEQEILKQKALLDSLDKEIDVKEKALNEKQRQLNRQVAQISRQQGEINIQKEVIFTQQREVQVQKDTLSIQKIRIEAQLSEIDSQLKTIVEQEGKIKLQIETLEKQKMVLYFVIFGLLLASFLAYYIYRGYRIKKEANIILEEKNRTISAQKDEIVKQRDLATAQRDQIAYQKRHITDSIIYAKRIQTALLPSLELFSDKLEHFVLYKPLDIVSGDFYWVSRKDNIQVIIAADCTGHGVPGAFMSMLGVTMLNEIVNEKHIFMPDQIIENLRQGVISALKQVADEDTVKDGMDISICTIDFDKDILWFAGANNPLYIVRNGELLHYRADKMPVAIHYRMQPFTLHKIDLRKGDAFYILSDGYADQFGGPNEKKFMTTQLRKLLIEIAGKPMLEQGEWLDNTFESWRGTNPQVDDVILIGVRY